MPCLDPLVSPFRVWIVVALLIVPCIAHNSESRQDPALDERVQQPIPFSHRLHSSLELDCVVCHQGSKTEASAGLPQAEDCLQCHQSVATESPQIVKLGKFAAADEPIPWVRIYRVPYFVFFSHSSHAGAGVMCQSCHGPVERQEVLKREHEMSMLFCVDCHTKSGASTECHLCHELNQ